MNIKKFVDYNEEVDLMNFINKNQTEYTPAHQSEYCFYNISCRKNPPQNVDLRIIHNTIVAMQNCFLIKDEKNYVFNNYNFKQINIL